MGIEILVVLPSPCISTGQAAQKEIKTCTVKKPARVRADRPHLVSMVRLQHTGMQPVSHHFFSASDWSLPITERIEPPPDNNILGRINEIE